MLDVILTSLVALLSSGTIIYLVIDKKVLSRKEKAESHSAEVSAKRDEFLAYKDMVDDLKSRHDDVMQRYSELHDDFISLKSDTSQKLGVLLTDIQGLKLQLEDSNWYRCEIPGCTFRKPPRSTKDKPCERLDSPQPTPKQIPNAV